MKPLVLVVDDIELNRLILREILSEDYEVADMPGGVEAIDYLFHTEELPAAILLDIMMPDMDGFEVLSLIKSNELTEKIPVLFITAADADANESKGLHAGAVDYIPKPFNPDVVKARVDNNIRLYQYSTNLEHLVLQKTEELTITHERMLESMADIIECRSLESGEHIRRTRELMKILAVRMLNKPVFREQLLEGNCDAIIRASVLHDIGKVGIPDSILLKPGKLSEDEFEIMKTHTTIGSEVLHNISSALTGDAIYLKHCEDICKYHHERWDGHGYPEGKKGLDIPLSARILSIVDVYDALVAERCYKAAMPHEKAVDIIKEGAGTQFDPDIIEVFLEVENDFQNLSHAM